MQLNCKKAARVNPIFSIVIPAFNEEQRILKTLFEWKKFLDTFFDENYEILVIMDGCTDRTPNIVINFAKENKSVIPIIYPKRLGKGKALHMAFNKAKGDFIFFTDADASLPVNEFLKFVRALKVSDIAIGCRYWRGSTFKSTVQTHRLILSRTFNALLKMLFKPLKGIPDTQCGAKALHRKVFLAIKDELFISDFAFDVNLIYSALRKGFTLTNVYVNWIHHEDYSKVSGAYLNIALKMLISILMLRIYYSRFRKLLYSRHLRVLLKFLYRNRL